MSGENCSSIEDKNYHRHLKVDDCVIEVQRNNAPFIQNYSEGNAGSPIQPLPVTNEIFNEVKPEGNNTEGSNPTVQQFTQTRYETRQSSRNAAMGTNPDNKSGKQNMETTEQTPSSSNETFLNSIKEFKNNTLDKMQTADINFTPPAESEAASMPNDKVIIPKKKVQRKKRPSLAPRRRSRVTKPKKPKIVVTSQAIKNYLNSVIQTEPFKIPISDSTSQWNKVPNTNFSTQSIMAKPAIIVTPSSNTLKELLERNSTSIFKNITSKRVINIPKVAQKKIIGAIKVPTAKKTTSLRPNLALIKAPNNGEIQFRNCGAFIIIFKKEQAEIDSLNSTNKTGSNVNTEPKLKSILKTNNLPLHTTPNNSSDTSTDSKVRGVSRKARGVSRKARGNYCNKCVKFYRDSIKMDQNTYSDVLAGSPSEAGGNLGEYDVAFKKLQPLSTRILRCIALLKFVQQPLDTVKVIPIFCDPPQTPDNEPSNVEPPDPTSVLLSDCSSSDDDDLPDVQLGYGMPSVKEIVAETRQARHEVRRTEMQKYMTKLFNNSDDFWKERAFLSMMMKHITCDGKTQWNSTQIINNILADEEMKNLFTPLEKKNLQKNALSVDESGPVAIIVPNSLEARMFVSRCIENHCKSKSASCASYCWEYLCGNNKKGLFAACTALFSNGERCKAVVKKIDNNARLCALHTWKRDNYDRLRRENQNKVQNENAPRALLVSPVYSRNAAGHSFESTSQTLCTKPTALNCVVKSFGDKVKQEVGATSNFLLNDNTDDPVMSAISQNDFMDNFITYDTNVGAGPELPEVILAPLHLEKVETFQDMEENRFEEANRIVAKIVVKKF